MCISRATVSAVSCLVVPAFICIDLLISLVLKINDDDDDDMGSHNTRQYNKSICNVHMVDYRVESVLCATRHK